MAVALRHAGLQRLAARSLTGGNVAKSHRRQLCVSASKGFGALKELREVRKEGAKGGEERYADKLEYSLPLEIVKYPETTLREENKLIKHFDDSLATLSREMLDVMYRTDGIGLAAPQVGVNVRLMVYNPTGDSKEKGSEYVLINPRIVRRSSREAWFTEGCLSFPGIEADIKRPEECTVEAKDLSGNDVRLELDGLEARVFQHEYDHLDGILFHDRMPPSEHRRIKPQLDHLEWEHAQQRQGSSS